MKRLKIGLIFCLLLSSEIALSYIGEGTMGKFDASDRVDPRNPGVIWRSFSVVDPSVFGNRLVSTKIAFSPDRGANFYDYTILNRANDNLPGGYNEIHEVSNIFYDFNEPNRNARWKIIWMHYFQSNELGGVMDIRKLWFGLRTAPQPFGPWSAEVKFMAGTFYDANNSLSPGEPLYRSDCAVLSEPSVLSVPGATYLTYQCTKGGWGPRYDSLRVTKLSTGGNGPKFTELGTFLSYDDVLPFNSTYGPFSSEFANTVAFTAPELVATKSGVYLLVTLADKDYLYRGCIAFQVSNLESPQVIKTENGTPAAVAYVPGIPGTFRGACTYTNTSTGSGIVLSQLSYKNNNMFFNLVKTGIPLP